MIPFNGQRRFQRACGLRTRCFPIRPSGLTAMVVIGLLSSLGLHVASGSLSARASESLPSGWQTRTFGECGVASHSACVVDGDTFWLDGVKVRIADIDTPELSPPRCDYERRLGLKAKARLSELLSADPFVLETGSRDEDRYGRKLRVVRTKSGNSVGTVLVNEGLARVWDGSRHPWCS